MIVINLKTVDKLHILLKDHVIVNIYMTIMIYNEKRTKRNLKL